LHVALAHLYFLVGRYQEMRDAAERGAEMARSVRDQRLLGEAEMRRGTALLMMGQIEEGRLVVEGALPLLEAGGDLRALNIALNNLGAACQHLGRMEQMRRWLERALEVAERMGNPSRTCYQLGSLGLGLSILGEWQEAREVLERGVGMTGSMSRVADVASPVACLGKLALLEGDWEEASRYLHEALAVAEETGDLQWREITQGFLAELDVLEGRSEEAISRLEPLVEQEDAGLEWILTPLAWAYLASDEEEQIRRAEETAERAVAWGRQQPGFLADALRIKGMVLIRQGRHEEAERALEDGLAVAGSQPYPYGQGRILYELGLMHREREAPQRARECLEQALATFRRLGARPYIERAEQALHDLE
jgi:tetratricopeptide (TPR) repeat protein